MPGWAEHSIRYPTSLLKTRIIDSKSPPPNFSLGANVLAGALVGIAERSVMYPGDLSEDSASLATVYPIPRWTLGEVVSPSLVRRGGVALPRSERWCRPPSFGKVVSPPPSFGEVLSHALSPSFGEVVSHPSV